MGRWSGRWWRRAGRWCEAAGLAVALALCAGAGRRAVMVEGPLPGADARVGESLRACAERAGFEVRVAGEGAVPGAGEVDLLILPRARALPLSTVEGVRAYVEGGGNVLAAGLPAWGDLVTEAGGRYLTRADYERAVRETRAARGLVDFSKEGVAGWRHSSDRGERPAAEVDGGVMHVVVGSLTNWDNYSRVFERPFVGGHTLTCFRARGAVGTTQLAVEWEERDGSRWIATVELGTEWRDYAVAPEAFVAWQPPKGRGGAGDRFRPENAVRFSVGLAFSHTDVGRGRHEYWVEGIGTAPHPFGHAPEVGAVPVIEGMSPGWQVYEVRDVGRVEVAGGGAVDGAGVTHAIQPRPQGGGWGKGRRWRWEPLMEAYGARDREDTAGRAGHGTTGADRAYRGAVGVVMVDGETGGARVCLTPEGAGFYERAEVREGIVRALAGVRRGVWLREGGASRYTVFEGEGVDLGARVVRAKGAEGVDAVVRVTVSGGGKVVWERAWEAGEGRERWVPPVGAWPAGGYEVVAELRVGGEVVDRVSHGLHVWRPDPAGEFVKVREGRFELGGKAWRAHGVNYMPSSGIGLADNEAFEHWIGAKGYDPEVIARDLGRVRGMGFNAVSAFIYRGSMEAGNLLDFLRQCREVGLRVNLSLRPGTPMEFPWKGVREMIEHYRLAENETVFAYDLAWEPTHGDRAYQEKHYGAAWREWVGRRHGSVAGAERVWGMKWEGVPRTEWLLEDGAWRGMVADYRLFLDELLAERYGRARELVRSVDPNHAVSFRMNVAGDPTARVPEMLGYDFWGLRGAVDFYGPEGYGRIGDWPWVRPGIFTAAYARLCNPALPVVWTEMGVSTWEQGGRGSSSVARQAFQARFYRDVYRMLGESGADGVFFWWYPGGFRVNERSDYGVINEDGTDRPVTRVIREEGRRWAEGGGEARGEEVVIEVDRDADARGLNGMYRKVDEEFWRAHEAGRRVRLKWATEPAGAR